MTTEPRLFWEHGTLLQPQHFQLLEMSRATDCALLASLSSPYPWGCANFKSTRMPWLSGSSA